MKLQQLRDVIGQEVKAAIKEELQDMLNEAVKIASQVQTETQQPKAVQEQFTNYQPKETNLYKTGDPIQDLLQETRTSMTGEQYRDVYAGTSNMVTKPNLSQTTASQIDATGLEPGLDLNKLPFAKKAGAVFKKSLEKDKKRAQG